MKTFAALVFAVAATWFVSPAHADCPAAVKCPGNLSSFVHVVVGGDEECDREDCLVCVGPICPID